MHADVHFRSNAGENTDNGSNDDVSVKYKVPIVRGNLNADDKNTCV